MQIAELTCRHVRIPLKRTVRHASHERTETDSIIMSCRLNDGTIGWGEGLPREYVTGDTIESDLELFQQSDWRDAIRGSIENLSDAIERLDRLRFDRFNSSQRDCFGHPLKCAIELAVLDAVCRRLKIPLSAVSREVRSAAVIVGDPVRVQYSGVITSSTLSQARKYARLYRWTGFRHCKVKVGTTGIHDVDFVGAVRRTIGSRVALRADANEAWTAETILDRIEPLRKFNLVAIEQPVPHAQIESLAPLRHQIGIPVMLDESLCSLSDGDRAIDLGYADAFNIRLSKCGGFITSLKLAALAHNAGLQFQLGCQVGETGILSAAGRHFAATVRGWIAAEGSFERFLVRERLTKEDLTFGCAGYAPVLVQPGLGVSIDADAIERVTRFTTTATL